MENLETLVNVIWLKVYFISSVDSVKIIQKDPNTV